MKNFVARTDGINMRLDPEMTSTDRAKICPGLLMIMNTDGNLELLGSNDVDLTNKHLVYWCNSHADSVNKLGNDMVAAIPLTKQFEFSIDLTHDDEFLANGFNLGPGDLLKISGGVLDEASGTGDYVIGAIKAGTCDEENIAEGAYVTITIQTWGGDYTIEG